MIKVNFINNRTGCNYIRVNRRVALKAFKRGITLVVYGRMDNPNCNWNSPSFWTYADDSDIIDRGTIPDEEWMEYHFKRLENSFEFYNNKKPWWYLPESVVEFLNK